MCFIEETVYDFDQGLRPLFAHVQVTKFRESKFTITML